MPDSKITALTALTAADPAVDMFPVVDVSDTTMAASGTTKRISINNILACSPAATLASATITGDLTVDTSTLKVDSANNRVGIGTAIPAVALDVIGNFNLGATSAVNGAFQEISFPAGAYKKCSIRGYSAGTADAGELRFYTAPVGDLIAERYKIDSTGIATWSNVGGVAGTAMTLNATGLGVGKTPTVKLDIGGTGTQVARIQTSTSGDPTLTLEAAGVDNCSILYDRTNGGMRFDISAITGAMRLSTTGNVGIGVTPSAWTTSYNALNIGSGGSIAAYKSANYDQLYVGSNFFENTSGAWRFINNGYATQYWHNSGSHVWRISTTSNAAGANQPLSWNSAMTLDTSGRLILLASTTTPATLSTNGQLTFTATSDTNLRFSYRGSDGVTRVANLTLA